MGLFLVALFVVFRKKYSRPTMNVAAAVFVLVIMLLGEIAQESDTVDTFPILIGVGTLVDLLVWPFLLFYVQHITGNAVSGWRRWLYFIPFLIALMYSLPALSLPDAEQLAYYSGGIRPETVVLVSFKMVVAITFLSNSIRLLSQPTGEPAIINIKSKRREFLANTRKFFVGVTIMVGVIYLLFYVNYFHLFPIGDSDKIGSLLVSGFFYFFAGMIFQNSELFREESYSKSITEFFGGKEQQFANDLLKHFEEGKLYLNEKLSVGDVAERMKLSAQQVSYLINRHLGVAFSDLVNSYRVEEVKARVARGEHHQKTLLGVALESGFNSKASFNRIFKDQVGMSPSEFVKNP